MSISKEQKEDIAQRKAVLNPLQASLQEIYHYFRTVHGTQPSHKDVVKLITELAENETKVGQGGH